MGDIKRFSNFIIGGDLQGEYGVTSTLKVILSAGYLNFSSKSGISLTGFIPVLLGGKYYFIDKICNYA